MVRSTQARGQFVPFSLYARRCLRSNFALTQLKVGLCEVVRRVRWAKETQKTFEFNQVCNCQYSNNAVQLNYTDNYFETSHLLLAPSTANLISQREEEVRSERRDVKRNMAIEFYLRYTIHPKNKRYECVWYLLPDDLYLTAIQVAIILHSIRNPSQERICRFNTKLGFPLLMPDSDIDTF